MRRVYRPLPKSKPKPNPNPKPGVVPEPKWRYNRREWVEENKLETSSDKYAALNTIAPSGWYTDSAMAVYLYTLGESLDSRIFHIGLTTGHRYDISLEETGYPVWELYMCNDDAALGTHWWLAAFSSHHRILEIWDAYYASWDKGPDARIEVYKKFLTDNWDFRDMLVTAGVIHKEEDGVVQFDLGRIKFRIWHAPDDVNCGTRCLEAFEAFIELHRDDPTGRPIHEKFAERLEADEFRGQYTTFKEDAEYLCLFRRRLLLLLNQYYDVLSFQECVEQVLGIFSRGLMTEANFKSWRERHIQALRNRGVQFS